MEKENGQAKATAVLSNTVSKDKAWVDKNANRPCVPPHVSSFLEDNTSVLLNKKRRQHMFHRRRL